MDLKETEILGDRVEDHWYYLSKSRALQGCLEGRRFRRVLDVGAGSGFFSRWLLKHTDAAEATCVDTGYQEDRDELVAGKSLRFRRQCAESGADLLLFMDVIEHVDDDAGLLRDYRAHVRPGAIWVVSVPAFPALWSAHDVFLGHRRRYTSRSLRACVEKAGLDILGINYYFAAVLPIAAATRITQRVRGADRGEPRSQLRVHSPFVNGALAAICRAELPLMRFNRLGGLTLFCVCTNRE